MARSTYDLLAQQYTENGDTSTPVSGVGDRAAIFHNEPAVDLIFFAKGSAIVAISVYPAVSDSDLSAIGVIAASRLP